MGRLARFVLQFACQPTFIITTEGAEGLRQLAGETIWAPRGGGGGGEGNEGSEATGNDAGLCVAAGCCAAAPAWRPAFPPASPESMTGRACCELPTNTIFELGAAASFSVA